MSLFVGGGQASKVFVGSSSASAVYLGATKVWPTQVPVFKAAEFGTGTTVQIPAHAAGDLLVTVALSAQSGTVVAPTAGGTVPAWNSIRTGLGYGAFYAVATSGNHTAGTFNTTSSGTVAVAVIGNSGETIGAASTGSMSASSSHTYPAVSLANNDGSSMLLHLCAQLGTAKWTAPDGYTMLTPTGKRGYAAIKNTTATAAQATFTASATATATYLRLEIAG